MVYDSIKALAEDKSIDVVIFSGSDRSKLEETFGDLNVWLAAENGMYLLSPNQDPDHDVSTACRVPCLFMLMEGQKQSHGIPCQTSLIFDKDLS